MSPHSDTFQVGCASCVLQDVCPATEVFRFGLLFLPKNTLGGSARRSAGIGGFRFLIDTITLQQEPTMRCLIKHKWVRKVPSVRSVVPIRTCEQCGTMQRGIYDPFWRDIAWETMRERAYTKPTQIQVARQISSSWETIEGGAYVTWERAQIVRKPSSLLDRLAHSLGLRRNRMSDRRGAGKRSALK